jgi:hypothetical protein
MALTQLILAPTTAASNNAVEFTVPMGETGVLSLYNAVGGSLSLLPPTQVTLKNPAGTFMDTAFILGNGAGGYPSVSLPNGEYSFKKPLTTEAVGLMMNIVDVVGP